MKRAVYRDHTVELNSDRTRSGRWVPRATILIEDGKTVKRIPIYGRRRASFDTQREADSCALELAKLWIEGRLSGGNGRY
ncbi:MAG TPA: hypothetical protein VGB25_09805 [Candidatus Binatia bacterium]